ncbi:MAG: hypothetical protein WBM35_12730 [Candidatus Electrothrix sp.]
MAELEFRIIAENRTTTGEPSNSVTAVLALAPAKKEGQHERSFSKKLSK